MRENKFLLLSQPACATLLQQAKDKDINAERLECATANISNPALLADSQTSYESSCDLKP